MNEGGQATSSRLISGAVPRQDPRAHGAGRGFRAAALALSLLAATFVSGQAARETPRAVGALQAYDQASRLRARLEAKPEKTRSVSEYREVIHAFALAFSNYPGYRDSPAALATAAQLYEEMARTFGRDTFYESAIKCYHILGQQYPTTEISRDALYSIAEIYRAQLSRPEDARRVYRQVIDAYPGTAKAHEAKSRLKQMGEIATDTPAVPPPAPPGARESNLSASKAVALGSNVPDSGQSTPATPYLGSGQPQQARAGRGPAWLTGVRCWKGPNYERVVLTTSDEVQFTSSRMDHPDRLVLDLRGAEPSHDLLGRSFSLNDVFLRDIRIGQVHTGITRAVLDFNQMSDYSVFSLPNPFRLVIDIHGKSTSDRASSVIANSHRLENKASRDNLPSAPDRQQSAQVPKAATFPMPSSVSASQSAAARPTSFGPRTDKGRLTTSATSQVPTRTPHLPASAPLEHPVSQRGIAGAFPIRQEDLREARAAAGLEPTVGQAGTEIATALPLPPSHKPALPSTPGTAAGAGTGTILEQQLSPNVDSSSPTVSAPGLAGAKPRSLAPSPTTASGSHTLTRVLGLKIGRIVIDAGHGGHDTGTIGPHGLREKDLVLDVALRLRTLLEEKVGAEVILTRSDDTFIPLQERTAIANHHGADLFISIHANASSDSTARGIETYYLNFTSDQHALEVAARENAASGENVHDLRTLIQRIALTEKVRESQDLAGDVQRSLWKEVVRGGNTQRDRGVKRAPFVVLIGANMPSILAEISFITNPRDERNLKKPAYREDIAEALLNGIERYTDSLGGVRVAQKSIRSLPLAGTVEAVTASSGAK